jgi:hypothetical protein
MWFLLPGVENDAEPDLKARELHKQVQKYTTMLHTP